MTTQSVQLVPMNFSRANTAEFRRESLTDLQRSVLLTVLYADLFDFPLTQDELMERLVLRRASQQAICRCVRSLTDRYLTASGPYVTWKGREHLVDLRRHRAGASRDLWPSAERYAEWLSRIPFVRMVAVSGSLAVENADAHSDVDLFCITEEKRLWLARFFIVALSKMTRLFPSVFPRYLCPNYILARNALEVLDRNLYTAHEVAQALPLYGAQVHADFLHANPWIHAFLPYESTAAAFDMERPRSVAASVFEFIFAGRVGDWIDEAIYQAFCAFYRQRALRLGWCWRRLERAYQRNRYIVPEDGYVPVVRRLFVQRMEHLLGSTCCDGDVRRLFPDDQIGENTGLNDDPTSAESCYDWEAQFRRDYGERYDGRAYPDTSPPIESSHPRATPTRSNTPA